MPGNAVRVWLQIPRPIAVIIMFAGCGLATWLIGYDSVVRALGCCIAMGVVTLGYQYLEGVRLKRLGRPTRAEIAVVAATGVLCIAAWIVIFMPR